MAEASTTIDMLSIARKELQADKDRLAKWESIEWTLKHDIGNALDELFIADSPFNAEDIQSRLTAVANHVREYDEKRKSYLDDDRSPSELSRFADFSHAVDSRIPGAAKLAASLIAVTVMDPETARAQLLRLCKERNSQLKRAIHWMGFFARTLYVSRYPEIYKFFTPNECDSVRAILLDLRARRSRYSDTLDPSEEGVPEQNFYPCTVADLTFLSSQEIKYGSLRSKGRPGTVQFLRAMLSLAQYSESRYSERRVLKRAGSLATASAAIQHAARKMLREVSYPRTISQVTEGEVLLYFKGNLIATGR